MITVVNKRTSAVGEYIGRPSPLGNPFVIDHDGNRETVIALYAEWLASQIGTNNRTVCNELNRLYQLAKRGNLALQCYCAPRACHGDIIKAVIEQQLTLRNQPS